MWQVRRALAQFPTARGREWLAFERPVETLVADSLDRVVPVLGGVERAAEAGLWAVGFVSYDAAPAFDPALAARRENRVPLALFGLFERTEAAGSGASGLWPSGEYRLGSWSSATSASDFGAAVRRVQGWIAAGESYQVNLTVRLRAAFAGDPLRFFLDLARRQSAGQMAFLEIEDTAREARAALCSSSPELFVARRGELLTSRPMKGTMPRHEDGTRDRANAEELRASAKERAENTMIVDMVRNDLGRIARPGSVSVVTLHEVESYPTVHQMTSTVTARSDRGLTDVLRALFPPASITGAPKVRCCQLITELEPTPRSVYTGTVGVVAPGGDLELNVAIRTAWIDLGRGRAEYGVGCGIVADSDPLNEWLEVIAKTRILGAGAPRLRLLETMVWRPSAGVSLLERHLKRLARSAQRFGYPVDLELVRERLRRVDGERPLRLRLLLGDRGEVEVERGQLPPPPPEPWRLPIDPVPVDSRDALLRHKTTAREVYEAARARHPRALDVVLQNERGEATETTIGNLVAEVDGRLVTPPVSCGLLPGVQREELLERGEIEERVVSVAELRAARRCWMVNAVRGRVPVLVEP